MNVRPDPKPVRAPKRRGRTLRRQVHDPAAMRECVLRERECRVCRRPAATAHHVVARGGPHYGDDVAVNLVALCGSGTSGCHGLIENHDKAACAALGRTFDEDTVAYVLALLGDEPGREYLLRRYHLDWQP